MREARVSLETCLGCGGVNTGGRNRSVGASGARCNQIAMGSVNPPFLGLNCFTIVHWCGM